jgi:hypothetical protein
VLFELIDDVIGDGVALVLGEAGLMAANDLTGAHERKRNRVSEHIATGHAL